MRTGDVRGLLSLSAVGFLAAILTSCGDSTTPNQGVNEGPSYQAITASSGAEVEDSAMRKVLRNLTRDVAIALGNEELRGAVYGAIQASPFREHKLHFRTFLGGPGQGLLRAMAAANGQEPQDILAQLDSVVDLEFYMPMPAHFAEWRGDTALLVGSVLHDDGTVPDVFDLRGNEVHVQSAKVAPTTPTLGLVPAETDFSRPPRAPSRGSIPQTAASSISGFYMTEAYVPDSHEGFLMGQPEFEVHVFVQQPNGGYQDVTCSGEKQADPFYYDQNDALWTGSVLIASAATVGSNNVHFEMWEDDTDACTSSGGRPPHTDGPTITQLSAWASSILNIFSGGGNTKTVVSIIAAVPVTINLFSSLEKDDLVGVMQPPSCYSDSSGVYTFRINSSVDGHPSEGYAKIAYPQGYSINPMCTSGQGSPPPAPGWTVSIDGQTAITPTASCTWVANTGTGNGPFTYGWYRNGVLVGSDDNYVDGMDGASSFELHLSVQDLSGNYAFHTITVTDQGFGECLQM